MVLCRLMSVCFLMLNCYLAKYNAAVLRSSSSAPISYDQQQTGDLNVRLHLKDFQIITIFGDDVLSSLNDDYEEIDYHIPEEYLDIQLATTQNSTSTSTTTPLPTTTETTTKKLEVTTTSSTTPPPRTTVTTRITTRKPEIYKSTTTASTSKIVSTTDTKLTTVNKLETTLNSNGKNKIPHKKSGNGNAIRIDKIPVVVVQENISRGLNNMTKKIVSASVAIVTPSEEVNRKIPESQVILGEILHYKKCPQGYSRDKSGRCIKIRRQQPIFDLTRLTSNLATRFKHSTSTDKQVK